MNVLIVDDEMPARDRMRGLLEEIAEVHVVGEAVNGEEALAQCREAPVDLVFLDVRMPGKGGIEAASELRALESAPQIIFTTAYSEHAMEAFDLQAADYLLKPVRGERLRQALERAGALLAARPEETGFVISQQQGRLTRIELSDVFYFMADHKYVTVRYTQGEALLENSLKQLEAEFGEHLVRIHRNALVARRLLIGMERTGSGSYRAVLKGVDETLDISRRHVPEIRKLLSVG